MLHPTKTYCSLLASLLLLLSAISISSATEDKKGGRRSLFKRKNPGHLLNPLADFTGASATENALAKGSDLEGAMAERGYSLVSSRESHGVTFEFWTEEASARKARSLEELVPVDLEKRDINIEGRRCETACAFQTNVPKANTTECKVAYNELYGTYGRFTLPAGQALSAKTSSCSIWIVNHSSDSITYDYWDAAGTGQWLNGHCIQEQGATVGVCQYTGIGTNVTNGVWTAVCHPTFMTGNPS